MKKKILITAGGTATAWHMSNVIKEFFADRVELHICDINPPELVASSIKADKFHMVPPIVSSKYKENMISLLDEENIDYIVPLIDFDLFTFAKDDAGLKQIGVNSTGPLSGTVEKLTDKYKMCRFLRSNGIATPQTLSIDEIENTTKYMVKPRIGCGSKQTGMMLGCEIKESLLDTEKFIIQELCDENTEEVTAEVFNACGKLKIFCRVRIETKEGVCTKMRHVYIPEIDDAIKKLVNTIPMPTAFCIQFMKLKGMWNIIDCNLRIGAGTALTTACGFQLTRAFFSNILEEDIEEEWFQIDSKVKTVLRVYKEVVMK